MRRTFRLIHSTAARGGGTKQPPKWGRRVTTVSAATVLAASVVGVVQVTSQSSPVREDNSLSYPDPSKFPRIPPRQEQLSALKKVDNKFDVLIIGGGASGAGCALDAASRRLKVALVE